MNQILMKETKEQTLTTSSLNLKPTLTTLPSELYDLIFINCHLKDLHFKLRYTNKLFYNLIPPFIAHQLSLSLLTNPSLKNYNQEVFITKNVLTIKLTSKLPPFEIFPWVIRMKKLCNSVDKVVSMIVKVVKRHEKINKIGMENNHENGNMEILSRNKKWTWINC